MCVCVCVFVCLYSINMLKLNDWDMAEEILKKILKNKERVKTKEGDGAFYGPKIDVEILDSMGKLFSL